MKLQIIDNIKSYKAGNLAEVWKTDLATARRLKAGEAVSFDNAADAFAAIDWCNEHHIAHDTIKEPIKNIQKEEVDNG